MDKFKIKLPEYTPTPSPAIVRVDPATYDKVYQVKRKTGLSMTKVLAQMVDFCVERMDDK